MLGITIGIKVIGIGFLIERTKLARILMYYKGDFDQTRFPVGAILPTTLREIAWPKSSCDKAEISQF